jgi:hypothetical protein
VTGWYEEKERPYTLKEPDDLLFDFRLVIFSARKTSICGEYAKDAAG